MTWAPVQSSLIHGIGPLSLGGNNGHMSRLSRLFPSPLHPLPSLYLETIPEDALKGSVNTAQWSRASPLAVFKVWIWLFHSGSPQYLSYPWVTLLPQFLKCKEGFEHQPYVDVKKIKMRWVGRVFTTLIVMRESACKLLASFFLPWHAWWWVCLCGLPATPTRVRCN